MLPTRSAAAHFLLFVLLSACATNDGAGEGSAIGDARASIYKCRAIADWINPFLDQYPTLPLSNTPPEAANLFRDPFFKPVFGLSYTQANAGRLATIHKNVFMPCIAPDIDNSDSTLLTCYQEFYNRTLARFDPEMARQAIVNSRRAHWMRQVYDELPNLPDNEQGLKHLDTEFASPGRFLIASLWPREQEEFQQALTERRAAIVARIGGFQPLPPSPLVPQQPATGLAPPPPHTLTVAERVAQRRAALEAIPLNLAGRAQSAAWISSLNNEFAAYNGDHDVAAARAAWLARREEIFRATEEDFAARLASLPAGPGAEAAHAQLLSETFPLPSDRTMHVYAEYSAITREQQKPFVTRTYDSIASGFSALHQWITGAARTVVHGSEKP